MDQIVDNICLLQNLTFVLKKLRTYNNHVIFFNKSCNHWLQQSLLTNFVEIVIRLK